MSNVRLILHCGLPADSGKSTLIDELARLTNNTDLIRIHVDDQMDAKSLLGAYVTTAVPGEFAWQPGPVAQVGHHLICSSPAFLGMLLQACFMSDSCLLHHDHGA